MTEPKKASINIRKTFVNVSLKTLVAIVSALNPVAAGTTAFIAAIAENETLSSFLKQKGEEQLELPAPPSWTSSAQSWQAVCSSIEHRLPAAMDTVAVQLEHVQGIPTQTTVKQLLNQAIAQVLPTWDVPAQERGMVAAYVTPLVFTKAAEVLKPALDQMQADAQAKMVVKIFDQLRDMQQTGLSPVASAAPALASSTSVTSSVATMLEQKMQASAYDVYICYNEEDEAEVFPIGEALKVNGILPWFDFLGKPGRFKGKQQEHLIENIPAAAIFVGQYAIKQWQELQMYAFLNQFVERECPVIPVLLKSAPSKPKLPPFLATLVWVDFNRPVPDPLKQFIWGITDEHSTFE